MSESTEHHKVHSDYTVSSPTLYEMSDQTTVSVIRCIKTARLARFKGEL